jgi:hypothetical protein
LGAALKKLRSVLKYVDRMSLVHNLRAMEHTREAYWLRYPSTSPSRLRWRAVAVRHCFLVKLFRADRLKNLAIEQPNFAANAETGLKPALVGYDLEEVPISSINRSIATGTSTFSLTKVAPGIYWDAHVHLLEQSGKQAKHLTHVECGKGELTVTGIRNGRLSYRAHYAG